MLKVKLTPNSYRITKDGKPIAKGKVTPEAVAKLKAATKKQKAKPVRRGP